MSRRLLVLSLVLVVCLSGLAFAAEEPEYGGTFVYGIDADWGEMFNDVLSSSAYDSEVSDVIYDGLVGGNSDLEMVPQVAKSWEISDDNLTITFYLREGVKFHDGHEVTAEDVWYTYRTIMHPDYTGPRYSNFKSIKGAEAFHSGEADELEGIEIIDDYTISFKLEETFSPILTNFGYGILPYHILKDVPVANLEDSEFNRAPVGCGPFKFVEYKSQQHFIASAFDDYYKGRPYLDRVIFRRISEKSLPVHFEKREIDLAYNGVLNEHYDKIKELDHVKGLTYLNFGYSFISFNMTRPGLEDINVRRAITHALDKQVIIDAVKKGYGVPSNGHIHPASWAYDDEATVKYEYNPEKAKKILKENGYIDRDGDGVRESKDGTKLEFDYYTSQSSARGKQIAQVFQQMQKLVGVKINVKLVEFNSMIEKIVNTTDWDFTSLAWSLGIGVDPSNIFGSEGMWNFPRFKNKRADILNNKQLTTMDQERRKAYLSKWQEMLSEELPYIWLYFSIITDTMDSRIKGYNTNPGPLGPLYDTEGIMHHKLWIPSDQRIHSN